ncbi:hypothetical protein Cgig2_012522 [Carnegiea gigantea]|uniref:Uncharacterized protein n=1 Tax=Carnegiea gigantea TaxID=171969 RepID=A0A9Q1JP93_9CARY|nr:hypothetical protein Cgig2_012522 [Carnegiea gigantea]
MWIELYLTDSKLPTCNTRGTGCICSQGTTGVRYHDDRPRVVISTLCKAHDQIQMKVQLRRTEHTPWAYPTVSQGGTYCCHEYHDNESGKKDVDEPYLRDGRFSGVNGRRALPNCAGPIGGLQHLEQRTHADIPSLLQQHDKNNHVRRTWPYEGPTAAPTTMPINIGMHDTHAYQLIEMRAHEHKRGGELCCQIFAGFWETGLDPVCTVCF